MFQGCERLSFIAKTEHQLVSNQTMNKQLDRDAFTKFIIGARGEVNRRHASPADFTNDLIRTNAPADKGIDRCLLDGSEQALRCCVGRQKRFHFVQNRLIFSAGVFQKNTALLRCVLQCGREQVLNSAPLLLIQLCAPAESHGLTTLSPWPNRASQSLAICPAPRSLLPP